MDVQTYLVTLTHTGTTSQAIRRFNLSDLNVYVHVWVAAGFGIDVQRVPDDFQG